MNSFADPPTVRNTVPGSALAPGYTRNLPLLSSSGPHSVAAREMAASSGTAGGASAHGSSDGDRPGVATNGSVDANTNAPNQAIGAAAAAQQPKVVQTAFIHKLYKYGPPYIVASDARAPGLVRSQ